MDTNMSIMPKYMAIKNIILEEIKTGIFKKGELIPSEKILQEKYNVSRITVKRALDELALEGYVSRAQGKGTFVETDHVKSIPFEKKMISCSDEIRAINMTPSRKTVKHEVFVADKVIARELEIPEGSRVLHFARIYYADRTPINYSDGYINLQDLEGLEMFDLENNSLMHIIQNHFGLNIEMIRSSAEAVCAKEELAEWLEVEEGFPLIKLESLSGYMKEEQKFCEKVISYYRTDLLKISII